MIWKKGKRKIEYEGKFYYWYVRIGANGHRVHVLSEDKKIHLEYPFPDTEVPITPQTVREYLNAYYDIHSENTCQR